jgi:hypothetical protein
MKQINVRVDDSLGQAFYRFCERQRVTPYELLNAIIGFYSRGQILTEKAEGGNLGRDEALIELGQIVSDMKKFAKANGEFTDAVADLLQPHGVTITQLWPNWRKEGEEEKV